MQILNDHLSRDGFRLRGTMPSRLDSFSDVVFGFALTLIVVSLEVPKNFTELHHMLRGFFPFALTFLMLMIVWHAHYKFFRRYGLHDWGTMWLNGLLLFFVLFYVYPLKFMFSAMFDGNMIDSVWQLREMTMLYAGGFTAIYAIFAAFYANALHRAASLQLSRLELELTRIYMYEEAMNAAIGVLVFVLAFLLPARLATLSTFAFMLIGVHKTMFGAKGARICRAHGLETHQKPGVEM
jgi:uncharacterized membrane protein